MGHEFELLVYRLLQNGCSLPMQLMPVSKPPRKLKLCVQQGDVSVVEGGPGFWERGYGLMRAMKLVTETSLKQTGAAPPIYLGLNFPVIDAADARNRGFRVTIAKINPVKEPALKKLLTGLKLKSKEKMHIVHLVPSGFQPTLKPVYRDDVQWYRAEIPSPHKNPGVWGKVFRRNFSTVVRQLTRSRF